ncbi:two pore domain potassium channel family protein [Rhodococcus sp. ABRD24]|uniref:potassium channel family protein n=1 Tax=Rhodococcus sp. ABRD24 TaxID=2507582 RepID=UPI00103F201A|nr:potassium channel family protein [Rhodococcus sp. ABRD24]QBJ95490.1 two pore domain potassium channel family protein [Rhodococcus sp. ABRD24]
MADRHTLKELSTGGRLRLVWVMFVRPSVLVVVLTVAYFTLPMDRLSDTGAVVVLFSGLGSVVALCAWQVWRIIRSKTPALRAAQALLVTLPIYLLGSATADFLLAQLDHESFNEPLTRLDALYFTLTVFGTVGFGDIVAIGQTARAVVTVQIMGNLVMIAVGVKLLLQAAKWGKARRENEGGADAPEDARADS